MDNNGIEKAFENKHIKEIQKSELVFNDLFKDFYRKVSREMRYFKKPKGYNRSVWIKNKYLESQIDKYLIALHKDIVQITEQRITDGWNLANLKNDKIVKSYTKGMALSESIKEGMFIRNAEALSQFLKRKNNGLDLSKRVWRYTDEAKQGIGFFLETGLGTGRSTNSIATDLKQFLEQPKEFRRTLNKNEELVESSRMKNYKHIKGVYLEPHKNARRLVRTEINMAYRASDMERIRVLDFIVGYRVNLSHSHPKHDICDHMQGDYPKSFHFTGWHPNCFCFVTSILVPRNDFIQYLKSKKLKTKKIDIVPASATKYIAKNAEKLKKMNSRPYWFTDNYDIKNNDLVKSY